MTPPNNTLRAEYQQKLTAKEQTGKQHERLIQLTSYLNKLLLEIVDDHQITSRLRPIQNELKKVLGADIPTPYTADSLTPLKLAVWEQANKLQTKLLRENKHAVDYLEKYIEPITDLTQLQIEERETQTDILFKPLRSQFLEYRQAEINWNNPFDLFQATYTDPTYYTSVDWSALEEQSIPPRTEERNLYLQKAINYTPVMLDMVPMEVRHKLGKYQKFSTHKQLLTNVHPQQLAKDLIYFKAVLSDTQPLERLGVKATRRVQLCTHPDHAGKIFVYRTTTTTQSEPQKMPMITKSMAIYDDVYAFSRSQTYATQHAKKDLDNRDDLLHTFFTLRLNISDRKTIPSSQTIEQLRMILADKKNHHLVTIMHKHLNKLSKETHPERARNILRGAENQLLQRIHDQESIQTHITTQSNHANRMRVYAMLHRKRFGRAWREYIATHTELTHKDWSYFEKLITTYTQHLPRQSFAPYKTFSDEILTTLEAHQQTISPSLIEKIDILLAHHALIYVVSERYHKYKAGKNNPTTLPYLKWLTGTQAYLQTRRGDEASKTMDDLANHLELIDLLLQYPGESEETTSTDNDFSANEGLIEKTPAISPKEKTKAIKKQVNFITQRTFPF